MKGGDFLGVLNSYSASQGELCSMELVKVNLEISTTDEDSSRGLLAYDPV